MKLRDWRARESKTLKDLAEMLGLGHVSNPSRRVQRIETGEAPVDAIIADRIVSITGGEVSLQDLNETRLAFLSDSSKVAAE
jgi:transcriptional regulator with XRE-family HTH domain